MAQNPRAPKSIKVPASLSIGMLASLLLILCIKFFEKSYLHVHQSHIEQTIYLHDLLVIEERQKQTLIPEFFKAKTFSPENRARALADQRCSDEVYRGLAAPYQVTHLSEPLEKLFDAWVSALKKYPLAYFEHRLNMWLSVMAWGYPVGRFYSYNFDPVFGATPPGAEPLREFYKKTAYHLVFNTPLFTAWLWMLALAAAAGVGLFYRSERSLKEACLLSVGCSMRLATFPRPFAWTIATPGLS